MTCAKETVTALKMHGIDGLAEPYIGAIRFFCLHSFPVGEIVSQILLASDLLKLIAMLPDGDSLLDADRAIAIKLLREGKSVVDIFKKLRPKSTPKAIVP